MGVHYQNLTSSSALLGVVSDRLKIQKIYRSWGSSVTWLQSLAVTFWRDVAASCSRCLLHLQVATVCWGRHCFSGVSCVNNSDRIYTCCVILDKFYSTCSTWNHIIKFTGSKRVGYLQLGMFHVSCAACTDKNVACHKQQNLPRVWFAYCFSMPAIQQTRQNPVFNYLITSLSLQNWYMHFLANAINSLHL